MLINSRKGKNKTENPNESKQIKTKKKFKCFKPHQTSRFTVDPIFAYGQQIN